MGARDGHGAEATGGAGEPEEAAGGAGTLGAAAAGPAGGDEDELLKGCPAGGGPVPGGLPGLHQERRRRLPEEDEDGAGDEGHTEPAVRVGQARAWAWAVVQEVDVQWGGGGEHGEAG